jgi:protocatechuate 3,4-dioxygenase beta subunit
MKMRNAIPYISLVTALVVAGGLSCGADEPVIGGPCEGCELVFNGMPEILSWRARIAPPEEPGEALTIEGVVTDQEGRPAVGIIVYAYHTNAAGIYPPASTRHGRLRGWTRTDDMGRYHFDTIRPGAYPGRSVAQHVHMHIIEPGVATYWITSIVFSDDPLLTEKRRREALDGRGGSGVVEPIATLCSARKSRATNDERAGRGVNTGAGTPSVEVQRIVRE